MGSDLDKQDAVVKVYDPCGPWSWYLLNQNPEYPDELWAIFRGFTVEVVKASLLELEAYRDTQLGLSLDRDPYFMSMPAKEVWDKLHCGEDV